MASAAVTQQKPWACFPTVCPECLDIALVIDSSGSIGLYRWQNQVLQFIRLFGRTSQWVIGTAADEYQVIY